jgi:hypothetical protein
LRIFQEIVKNTGVVYHLIKGTWMEEFALFWADTGEQY